MHRVKQLLALRLETFKLSPACPLFATCPLCALLKTLGTPPPPYPIPAQTPASRRNKGQALRGSPNSGAYSRKYLTLALCSSGQLTITLA